MFKIWKNEMGLDVKVQHTGYQQLCLPYAKLPAIFITYQIMPGEGAFLNKKSSTLLFRCIKYYASLLVQGLYTKDIGTIIYAIEKMKERMKRVKGKDKRVKNQMLYIIWIHCRIIIVMIIINKHLRLDITG